MGTLETYRIARYENDKQYGWWLYEHWFNCLIIVFQQELRKFLLMIGSTNFANKRNFIKHFKFLKQEAMTSDTNVEAIVTACDKMGKTKTGALLVLERTNSLDFVKKFWRQNEY